MAPDRLLDLFANRVLCYSSISALFCYSYVRQTKLACTLVNFCAHDKISTGWLVENKYWL